MLPGDERAGVGRRTAHRDGRDQRDQRVDDGREGSVTVQHGGLESDPATWFGHIVPGTGTGDFTGWSGPARIVHDDQGAFFEIDLA